MQVEDLKAAITAQSVKTAEDEEALKKATRAQKQRAKRFEATVDKCNTQLKEKVRKKEWLLNQFLSVSLSSVFLPPR